jgi:DNA-binding GntR family transcriptional regulator
MDLLQRLPGGEPGIVRRRFKDQISDKLAYMIQSGLLRPGDELPSERQLAETLGVSRETVRSAIATLAQRRLIEVSHGARTRVIGPGKATLPELVQGLEKLKGHSFEEVSEAREEGKTRPEGIGEAARAGSIFKFLPGSACGRREKSCRRCGQGSASK